jgi:hypothetical protein
MSRYEPISQDISIRRNFFWYLIPGTKVKLDIVNDPTELSDWLEHTVGKNGEDWEWEWEWGLDKNNLAYELYYIIKIRKRRSHLISLLLLRFKT